MSRIYWDSMLFIYWLEDNPLFIKRVKAIRTRMDERQDQLITSAFTIGEVLAGPCRKGMSGQLDELRGVLLSVVSEIIPFTVDTADHYARIRGTLGVSAPDALHLACAASAGTDLFLTNDKDLVHCVVPGIQFIAGINSDVL